MLEASGMKHVGVAWWAQGRTAGGGGGDGESPAFSWWAQGRTTGGEWGDPHFLMVGTRKDNGVGMGRALLALVTLPVLGSETFLRPPLSDLGHGDSGVI